MVLKHYKSGLDFILDQAHSDKDWIALLTLSAASSFNFSSFRKPSGILKPPRCTSPVHKAVHFSPSLTCAPSNNQHQQNVSRSESNVLAGKALLNTFDPSDVIWRFWRWAETGSSLSSRSIENVNAFKDQLEPSNIHVYSTFALRNLAITEYPCLLEYFGEEVPSLHQASRAPRALRSYFVFKHGVPPLWEDDHNVDGGRWQVIIHLQDGLEPETIKRVWKELILVLTEQMIDWLKEICGIALTIRSNGSYKISVWNHDANNILAKLMIGQILKQALGEHSGNMFYYSHQSTMGKLSERQARL